MSRYPPFRRKFYTDYQDKSSQLSPREGWGRDGLGSQSPALRSATYAPLRVGTVPALRSCRVARSTLTTVYIVLFILGNQ